VHRSGNTKIMSLIARESFTSMEMADLWLAGSSAWILEE
jgi:hypothetical protein